MNNSYKLICILLTIVIAIGCSKEEIPPLGEPADKLEGISDAFVLTQVIFYDNLTDFDDNSLDVSETYIGPDPMTITFNKDNTQYTVKPGSSLNIFGESGTWSFDHEDFPTSIMFVPDDSEESLQTSLLRTIRPTDEQLQISIGGGCDKSSVTYELYFNRK